MLFILQWLDTVVLNWLTRIYNQGSLKIDAQNARVRDVLKEFRVKLEYYLYETYAHIIIDQFFTVIIGKWVVLSFIPAIPGVPIYTEIFSSQIFQIQSRQ